VGFPGETACDFADTLAVCSHAAFARIHQFPYSPRAGTPAATLPDRVPAADVKERQRRLAAVEAESCARSLERRVGKTARVAVETVAPDGGLEGYDERYHRTRVYTAGTLPVGALVGARVVAVEDGRLRAEA
jgi:threonylcarbamoyladenosine tRNA methylthiotransferase MtaB